MRIVRFIVAAVVTVLLIFILNSRLGSIPPLGKFFNPFTGFWQNAESTTLTLNKSEITSGLKTEVTVLYDDANVPHIFAENEHDLYFMQGYITARDRLWQMEIQTHAAAGRVSEILGKNLIAFDRETRRVGLYEAAKVALEDVKKDPKMYTILLAYSAGVNVYIDQLNPEKFPIEYKLLDYKPEHWSPLKSVLLLKYMAQMLTGKEYDAAYTAILAEYGKETVDLLYPAFPDDVEPIVPDFRIEGEIITVDTPQQAAAPAFYPKLTYNEPHPDNGSNNWAVAGSKTATGKPLLANDPHLGLNLPSLWYMVQLHGPELNVFGASLPGAPFVIIGFNEYVAWGVTNAQRDVRDWYQIKFKDSSKQNYFYDNEWKQTRKVIEEIEVRGGETIKDTVNYTHFGPVVFDENFSGDTTALNLALKWVAHDASKEIRAVYQLNRAKNYDDYAQAITYFKTPGQNFVFAAKDGDIAIWQQGKFPVRWPDQGMFIMDGTNPDHDWQGFIPQDQNPHIKNPERGFVSSANQHPVDSTYPYFFHGSFEYYRNRRINNVLASSNKLTFLDMMKLQNDNYNLKAEEGLPLMISFLNENNLSDSEKEHLKILKKWDFYSEKDAVAPALFELWLDTLMAQTFDEFKDAKQFEPPKQYVFLEFLKDHPQHNFFDMPSTEARETAGDIVQKSFADMSAFFSSWSSSNKLPLNWMNYKNTHLTHLARTLKPFDIDNVPIGGNSSIVNATSSTHGASWRMIVSLEDTIKAWGVYPGGQSGNPGSPYYADMVSRWAEGKYIPLLFLLSPDEKNERIVFTQKFNPK